MNETRKESAICNMNNLIKQVFDQNWTCQIDLLDKC